ncbi:DUF4395 domain-containing protein [Sulfurimonas denitrificans]|nr:DUF4395 domain-containing protein [Sulfurimonas denitrificans]MDD3442906.1 DUF4395 domain-containing protein [Sulfurimonas denitrificans]
MTQIKLKTLNIIDENQTRMHAGLVVLILIAYMASGNLSFIYMLIYDFFARIYVTSLISPLYLLSKGLVNLIGLKQRFSEESAKEFASHIGLMIIFVALYAELLNWTSFSYMLITFFGVWKTFEATKDICFACKLYELLVRKNIRVESL